MDNWFERIAEICKKMLKPIVLVGLAVICLVAVVALCTTRNPVDIDRTQTHSSVEESSEISDNNIPTIANYRALAEALKTSSSKQNILNLSKDICSAFEALSTDKTNSSWKDDLNTISKVFSDFFSELKEAKKIIEIMPIKIEHPRFIQSHRNAESHNNYYYAEDESTKHTIWLEGSIALLPKPDQSKVRNRIPGDWVIFNYYDKKKIPIRFFYTISNNDMQLWYEQFVKMCNSIILKSIDNTK
ncbi:unnamed protein product [Adineta ricciae]|uniref:Uncharacterized protein n=1 Tax=Adineta ricciae TaxID=249248 RepID=A0A814PRW3_ADIRI|nr:unnamed protein product [Adineta ricciae]CAF1109672.1 unnamed protein product [Adineta ricciae]